MTFQRILSEEERGCVALGQRLEAAAVVTPSIRKTTINFQLKKTKKQNTYVHPVFALITP